jgi:hypothetical protein
VFLFSVWVIALDTQVGVERVNPSLVEMGRSFGASKRTLCSQIVLWAALPELLAGIRLGLIRGMKGVVIGQLLIAVVGVGYLFELYSRSFLMPEFWRCSSSCSRSPSSPRRRSPTWNERWRSMHPAADRTTSYAIPAPTVTTVAVDGMDAVFPVARVYCVGRNYAEHSIEMGHDPEREPRSSS